MEPTSSETTEIISKVSELKSMEKNKSKFDIKTSSINSVTTKNVDILPHILDEPEQQ